MDTIVQVISNVGFPIVMCLLIMYYWNNQYKTTIDELKEVVSQLAEVINHNTQTLNVILEYIKDDVDAKRMVADEEDIT